MKTKFISIALAAVCIYGGTAWADATDRSRYSTRRDREQKDEDKEKLSERERGALKDKEEDTDAKSASGVSGTDPYVSRPEHGIVDLPASTPHHGIVDLPLSTPHHGIIDTPEAAARRARHGTVITSSYVHGHPYHGGYDPYCPPGYPGYPPVAYGGVPYTVPLFPPGNSVFPSASITSIPIGGAHYGYPAYGYPPYGYPAYGYPTGPVYAPPVYPGGYYPGGYYYPGGHYNGNSRTTYGSVTIGGGNFRVNIGGSRTSHQTSRSTTVITGW